MSRRSKRNLCEDGEDDNVVDLPVFDLAAMLRTCSDAEYQEETRGIARTLVAFLDEHGLVKHRTWTSPDALTDDLLINESHMTDEGKRLVRAALDRWLGALDRNHKYEDDSVLRRALKKLRSEAR